jgi:tetratricopeptide (TPR) repeat protein
MGRTVSDGHNISRVTPAPFSPLCLAPASTHQPSPTSCALFLSKPQQAEELIKHRLEVTPDEPRLWCALGDLTLDDAHYRQAWECSGHRNARCVGVCGGRGPGRRQQAGWQAGCSGVPRVLLAAAACPSPASPCPLPPCSSQRSLARNALRNSRYAAAAQHWEAALALNPLHGEGWFRCGAWVGGDGKHTWGQTGRHACCLLPRQPQPTPLAFVSASLLSLSPLFPTPSPPLRPCSLGYCYIKEKDYPSALRAFTRSSQLEPENGVRAGWRRREGRAPDCWAGRTVACAPLTSPVSSSPLLLQEAWNNLAAIHMHLKRWPQAYNALSGGSGAGRAGRQEGGREEVQAARACPNKTVPPLKPSSPPPTRRRPQRA